MGFLANYFTWRSKGWIGEGLYVKSAHSGRRRTRNSLGTQHALIASLHAATERRSASSMSGGSPGAPNLMAMVRPATASGHSCRPGSWP